MRYIIYVVIAALIIIIIASGYLAFISGLNDLGPVIEQFSSAFGKLIGGLIMMISGVSLIGFLFHYYILKRRAK